MQIVQKLIGISFFFLKGPISLQHTSMTLVFIFQSAQGGGHRTLLYGHAILLRHSYSGMVRNRSWLQQWFLFYMKVMF